jgi:superoxide reductase
MSEFISTSKRRMEVEKHAPVIEAPDAVKAGEFFTVTAGLGKAIATRHAQHYIAWIPLLILPNGASCRSSSPTPNSGARRIDDGRARPRADQPDLDRQRQAGQFGHAAGGGLLQNIHGVWRRPRPIAVQA